jgi:uncharacterized delta-60 repeat protein
VVLASAAACVTLPASVHAATVGFDPAFGSGGPVLTSLGTPIGSADARANGVVHLADGRLVLGGYARDGRNNKFALARYNADGSLDTSFGSNGSVLTQVGLGEGSDDELKALAVQPDGKLVGAGFAATGQSQFALARYNADGSLDTTFNPHGAPGTGTPGTVLTSLGNASVARASSLVLQPDGKMVVAGFARVSATSEFALARYNPDGSLDTTFGTGGKVLTPIGAGGFAAVRSLVLQAGGTIVAAGIASADHDKFALARYKPDGSLDSTFGSSGIVLTQVGQGDALLNALITDDSGRLVAAGSALDAQGNDFALARYTANGSLDASFGTGGKVLTPVGADHGAAASALTTDAGRLVAGGVATDGGVSQFAFARYDASGALDTTFDSNGTLLTPIGDGGLAAANAVTLIGNQLLAAGYAKNGGGQVFALERYADLPGVAVAPVGPPAGSPASSCFHRLQVVVCPGTSKAQASTARCRVQSKSVRMSRKGRVKVRVTCDAAAKGTVTLKTGKKSSAHKKTKKGKKGKKRSRKLTVARGSFSLSKAASKTLNLKLSKAARRAIKSKKRLRVRVTVSARGDGAVKAAVATKSLTIKK